MPDPWQAECRKLVDTLDTEHGLPDQYPGCLTATDWSYHAPKTLQTSYDSIGAEQRTGSVWNEPAFLLSCVKLFCNFYMKTRCLGDTH